MTREEVVQIIRDEIARRDAALVVAPRSGRPRRWSKRQLKAAR